MLLPMMGTMEHAKAEWEWAGRASHHINMWEVGTAGEAHHTFPFYGNVCIGLVLAYSMK